MPDLSASDDDTPLRVELRALRAENEQLRRELSAQARPAGPDQQYEQSQARFRTVFEESPLGQKIIDDGLLIRQANAALVTMLGYQHVDQLVGRGILEFAHPRHRADWQQLQQRLWAHKTPHFSLETCLVRADGSDFWCRVTSVLFCDGGAELGYTTLEDISERKGLEDSLRRLYDAQETILHVVAHDLKSPINHIQMLVELLQRDAHLLASCPASTRQEALIYLNMIGQACTEAGTLLQDILYLGSLEARPQPLEPTDLSAFLAERLLVFELAAREKNICLTQELPPGPVYAGLHTGTFARAIDNLLTNALKFTPAGGQVRVLLSEQHGRVRLSVQDTGMGIPDAQQPHIFDKFSSAARTGLHGDPSTGLGLYITRQIVQLHRGKIWVESRENEGSTFVIELS
ncbi:ATP-binding protein [Hymenobacter sp. B81]|uniref:PAS domain-containing sensor histidine kinase n=1 Tax=Hymenobacter sp. B81 TaxID=3344878 RepID=UPI0037DC53EB